MNKTINKKILPEFFKEVASGNKTFEIRKDEDDIQVGDTLILREWDKKGYTGCMATVSVTYILRDAEQYGLMRGYCIIAFSRPKLDLRIGG